MKLPFVDHVGICIEEQRDGFSRCRLSIEDHHFNSASIVHGGVLFTLADTAMGAALSPTLGSGEGLVAKANGTFAIFRRKDVPAS